MPFTSIQAPKISRPASTSCFPLRQRSRRRAPGEHRAVARKVREDSSTLHTRPRCRRSTRPSATPRAACPSTTRRTRPACRSRATAARRSRAARRARRRARPLYEVEQVAVEQSQEQFLAERLGAQRLREERHEVIQAGRNHPCRENETHEPDRVFHGAPPRSRHVLPLPPRCPSRRAVEGSSKAT